MHSQPNFPTSPEPYPMQQRKREHGFSLIELMVTVFLAAILLGVAIPSFRAMTASNRLVTQTNDLIGALTLARSEAITRNRPATFCRVAAETDTTCAASAADWTFWIIRNADGVIRRGNIPTYGGALKVTAALTADTLVYSSDGVARTNNALVTTANTFQVCTNMSGENIRTLTPGVGSRLSIAKSTGTC